MPQHPEPETPAPLPTETPAVTVLEHTKEGSRWATFHQMRYRVQQPDGTQLEQGREFLDRGDAVALLPYCAETGNVLLTRQFRMPVYLRHPAEAMLLECCGGILDDPDPAVTARREAREEMGLELVSLEPVFEGYSSPGSVCEKIFYFLAPYAAEHRVHHGGGLLHEGEAVEVLEMPLTDALGKLRTGEIRDIRTIALLLELARRQPPAA